MNFARKRPCPFCQKKTSASQCPQCKGKKQRGARRAEAEAITIDEAGGAWWAWDKIGNVLAGPLDSKAAIWIALAPEKP